MFDISFTELVIAALVGLIVLGPKRLPEVARTAGQWLARVRRFVSDVRHDIDRELQHADLADLKNLRQELDETRRAMEETSGRLMQQANIDTSSEADTLPPTPPPAVDPPPAANSKSAPKRPRTKRRAKQPRKKATGSKQSA